ncbi:MAG: tRNA 2-thiouridine(34) synthase MnmA [Rhizobiales bacterium]|nr:tRNA 2-thiouridine(34) synthase MnmA [Hyphomicrobiales bacterium]
MNKLPADNLLDLPDSAGDARNARIVVAMSGGVDSSLAAAACARAGYEVVGVTLQLYDHGAGVPEGRTCCAGQDIHDARRVADQLGITHYVLDYESRFRSAVIDDFADAYAAGLTPLPCARCNERVKFADLLDMARQLDAAALVTGHYVASRAGPAGRTLHRARDGERDQSYFLFATTQAQLEMLRFPLGELTKDETRALARELGLSVADKPDSQDICFVPSGHYSALVERLRPEAAEPGDIVDMEGRVLGRHQGIIRFTIGQRRGLGIAAGEPLFVVRIDAARREVVVGPRQALETRQIRIGEINWLGARSALQMVGEELEVHVKIRSTQPPMPARLLFDEAGATVTLHDPEFGVSPGQACVIYESGAPLARVLGGGWIAHGATALAADRQSAGAAA